MTVDNNNFKAPRTLENIQMDLKIWHAELKHLEEDIQYKQITPEECSQKIIYLEKMSTDLKLTSEDVVARLENVNPVKEWVVKDSLTKMQEIIKKVTPIFQKVSKHCASAKIDSFEKKLNSSLVDDKNEAVLRNLHREIKTLSFVPLYSHEKDRILGLLDLIENALIVIDNDRMQRAQNFESLQIFLQSAHKFNDLRELKEKIPSGLLLDLKLIVFPMHYPMIQSYAHMNLFDGRFTVEQIMDGLKSLLVKMTTADETPVINSKEEKDDLAIISSPKFSQVEHSSFDDLSAFAVIPDEVIIRIMSFLRVKEICTCQLVNKRFQSISSDNALWKEKFITFSGCHPESKELSVKEQYKDIHLGGNIALKLSNTSFTSGTFFKNDAKRRSPVIRLSCHTSLNGSKLSRLARLSNFQIRTSTSLANPTYMFSGKCLVDFHDFETNTQMEILFQAPSSTNVLLLQHDTQFNKVSRASPKKVVSLGRSFLAAQFQRNFINVWELNANKGKPIFTCGDCSDIWEEKSLPNSLWICFSKGKNCALVDFTTGKTLVSIPNEDFVVDVRMLSDGHCLILNRRGKLEIWNTQKDTATLVSQCDISNPGNTTIVEVSNGILLFNSDDTIQQLNYKTGSLIKFEKLKSESINKFCILPRGDVCAIIVNEKSEKSTLVLLDKSTLEKKLEKSLTNVDPISINAISNRFVLIVSQAEKNSVQVLDLMNKEICAQCDIGASNGEIFRISPTKLLLMAQDNECIMINFDASKKEILTEASNHILSSDSLEISQKQRIFNLSLQDIIDIFNPLFEEIGIIPQNLTKEVLLDSLIKQSKWQREVQNRIDRYLDEKELKRSTSEITEMKRKVETIELISEYVED